MGLERLHLAPSRLMANLVALVYNWWNLCLRFYDEEHHREAIRTRPMLMSGVGRQIQSGGRRTVKVSVLHEKRRPHRASCHADQQRVASHPRHHGAMERGAALDAVIDAFAASLARRKVATRPSRRGLAPPQRVKTDSLATTRLQNQTPRSQVLHERAHFPFIRDVRKELNTPKLPFVIGVLGVGGPTAEYDSPRYKGMHQVFPDAMAAPANRPEFKGNVVAVKTEVFWDKNLEAARGKKVKTPDEEETAKGASNQGFHYLGAAKILGQIGKALADALAGMK